MDVNANQNKNVLYTVALHTEQSITAIIRPIDKNKEVNITIEVCFHL